MEITAAEKLKNIVNKFIPASEPLDIKPFGSGHINDTFLVKPENNPASLFILQRINHLIFKKPHELMDNVIRVTNHIFEKLKKSGENDIKRKVLRFYPTASGIYCFHDEDGNYWRLGDFISETKVYDCITDDRDAYNAANKFGEFLKMLGDLPLPVLFETIPDFHNSVKRYSAFQESVIADKFNRAAEVKALLDKINKYADIFESFAALQKSGQIPVRTVHNDTKINNILFDSETGKALCVIDLDTIMPGSAVIDFGDMVRSAATSAEEDEKDLSKVFVIESRFKALAEGFIHAGSGFLNECELNNLITGAKVIILEQTIRFLGDYLNGDCYYKTKYPGHNLVRAENQMKLFSSLIEQEKKFNGIIEKIRNARD